MSSLNAAAMKGAGLDAFLQRRKEAPSPARGQQNATDQTASRPGKGAEPQSIPSTDRNLPLFARSTARGRGGFRFAPRSSARAVPAQEPSTAQRDRPRDMFDTDVDSIGETTETSIAGGRPRAQGNGSDDETQTIRLPASIAQKFVRPDEIEEWKQYKARLDRLKGISGSFSLRNVQNEALAESDDSSTSKATSPKEQRAHSPQDTSQGISSHTSGPQNQDGAVDDGGLQKDNVPSDQAASGPLLFKKRPYPIPQSDQSDRIFQARPKMSTGAASPEESAGTSAADKSAPADDASSDNGSEMSSPNLDFLANEPDDLELSDVDIVNLGSHEDHGIDVVTRKSPVKSPDHDTARVSKVMQHTQEGPTRASKKTQVDAKPDYSPEELAKKNFSDLASEPFDHDPRAESDKPLFPKEIASDSLTAKMVYLCNQPTEASLSEQAKGSDNDTVALHRRFFSSLAIEEYDECGSLVVQRLGDIVSRLGGLRQEKRKVAREFEQKIAEREEIVRARSQGLEKGLERLRSKGEEVIRVK